jgi:hypothetical protein
MTLLVVEIEDTRSRQKEVRSLGEWHAAFPVDIGSGDACKVRLDGPGVAPHHARYKALGHHRFIEVLDEWAVVRVGDEQVRRGDYCRIDYRSFLIGPYRLAFGERKEPV